MTDHDPWYMTYEDETPTDERLVFELMCGIDVRCPPDRRFRRMYPTGDRELHARAALARLIRKGDPFPPRIREAFAALFDPTNTDRRHVEFKPGRQSSSQEITALIAAHVWAQLKMGDPKEAAVASAMEEFGLKRRRVFEICRDYEGDFPGLSALK